MVEESVIANLPSADKYGVQFNVIAQDRDLWGLTNPKIFHQVMTNLLSNAAKFSDGGSKIDVEINKAQDHVRISITNDGDGIPIEFQDHIFKPFSQAAPSATRSREGTGIGLSIVKQIVEQSGGKIGFESHAGKRTTFWFTPPRDQSQGG